MKRAVNLLLLLLMMLVSTQVLAQDDPNKAAKNIIKAYKGQDVALLKKYASGALAFTINENYFEGKDAKPLIEIAKGWDGKVREIRYNKSKMMGSTVVLGYVHIGDNASGKLNIVALTSLNKSEWKAFGLGITEMSREEFLEASLEIAEDKPIKKPKAGPKEKPQTGMAYNGFSVEMANGETFENPTIEKLNAGLKSIDDDNFFLILNGKNGFLQTSISESGYIIQHNEGKGMFEAKAYFTLEKMIELFGAYLRGENWIDMAEWNAI